MSSQYAFAPKDDDAIIRHRLMTRVSVTRGEPPMRRLVKKLMALSSEASKEEVEDEAAEEEEEGGKTSGGDDASGAEGDSSKAQSSRESKAAANMAEVEKAAKAFLLELAAFEQPLLKTRAVIGANRREQQRFREMQVELTQQIESAKDQISLLKVQLDEARAYRQREEECELVRRQIAQHPPRAESEAAIAALHQELEALERENVGCARVLDLRRKQFSLLLHTVDELQSVLEENNDSDLLSSLGPTGQESAPKERGKGLTGKSPLRDGQSTPMQVD